MPTPVMGWGAARGNQSDLALRVTLDVQNDAVREKFPGHQPAPLVVGTRQMVPSGDNCRGIASSLRFSQ
jgi:hypothetical protein